ncbi:MAG: hypothetical protein IJ072_06270 [Oscillospiraceae bacterium]|nr:hypothetical protein [Oscillospiraceae bacterium]
MIPYSVIMFTIAVLFLIIGIAIYRGNTNLIHDYHRAHVKREERLQYGKAFSKGMFAICATLTVSGILALFGTGGAIVGAAVGVLFVGLAVSFVILWRVQMKYNGGG